MRGLGAPDPADAGAVDADAVDRDAWDAGAADTDGAAATDGFVARAEDSSGAGLDGAGAD
jgi:hypothetical protein